MAGRGVSTVAQSSIGVILAIYLERLGLSLVQVGTFLGTGVAGAAFFTFIITLIGDRIGRRRLLVIFTLMSATAGIALIFIDNYLLLLLFAFLGCLTGAGATGPVGPLELASLADTARPSRRTDLFAFYRIMAVGGGAIGALAVSLPELFQTSLGVSETNSYRFLFGGFVVFLAIAAILYSLLSQGIETSGTTQRWSNPLKLPSRKLIFTLTGLFSLDNFAGSVFLESLAAYWFYTKFGLQLDQLALVFFLSRLLSALSLWTAAKLSNRIGLINTMVFTHIPASVFLMLAAFSPTAWLAVIFWQLRAFFSMMDTVPRDSYTMSIVGPEERTAMASIHIVGRSIAGTVGPIVGTTLWQLISAAAPLVGSGILKITYDLSLYFMFRNVKPPQEQPDDS